LWLHKKKLYIISSWTSHLCEPSSCIWPFPFLSKHRKLCTFVIICKCHLVNVMVNVIIWYPFPAHFLLMVRWVFQSYFMSVLVDHLQEVLGRGLRMGRVKRNYSQHTVFTGWNWTGISSGCLSIIVSVNLFLALTGACYAWRSYFSFYMHLNCSCSWNFRWQRNIIQTFMYWQVCLLLSFSFFYHRHLCLLYMIYFFDWNKRLKLWEHVVSFFCLCFRVV